MAYFSLSSHVKPHLHVRQTVWMPLAAMLAFMCIYLPVASLLVQASSPQSSVAAAPVHKITTATSVAGAPAAPTSHPSASSPACQPISFPTPSQLALAAQQNGLSVQADLPTTYQIYGTTADGLRSQIERCAPGADGSASAEFTAETSYSMVWQYDVAVSGSGCTLENVKVGVHTAMVLPEWQPTPSAANGLAGRWQNFMTSLAAHEQGHAALDSRYGAQLVSDLSALGPKDCNNLTANVNSVINADVSALNSANDNYDASTNHGATQGAVLPTY